MSKTSNNAKLECLKLWIESRKYKAKKITRKSYIKEEDED